MERRVVVGGIGAVALALGGGITYDYFRPEFMSVQDFDVTRCDLVRMTHSGRPARRNPGIRVEPVSALQAREQQAAAIDTCRQLAAKHAVTHITAAQSFAFALQMVEAGNTAWRGEVNMLRMTGRRERADQNVCPWLYADAFVPEMVPTTFRPISHELASRCARTEKLRDITINYRRDGYFRLDPHIDPLEDGPNVCIVSLSSPAVLTLAPKRVEDACRTLNAYLPKLLHIRHVPFAIDVLVPTGHALILQGPARYTWTHAIRQGTAFNPAVKDASKREVESKETTLWDTFGKDPIRRESERWSLVFAYG